MVDVRTALQFDEAHLPGSVSIPAVQAGFGTKLSWLADRAQEVVLIGRDDEDGIHAALLAAAVGITRIGGYLAGGMTSWREEKRRTDRIERIDVPALHDRMEREPDLQILDVREQAEWEERHIPGSTLTPYHDVRGIPDGIDPERPDRGDLQLGAAQRRGRQPAAAPRGAGGPARGRRRRRHLGSPGLAGRGAPGHTPVAP